MAQTILGIDVGTYSVKVAEVRRSFNLFQFTNFYERRIQYNEVLSREESIAAALQGVLEDNALTWDSAYAALPSAVIATRILELPFGSTKKIAQTIPFEVEDAIPFDIDQVVIDHHVIEASKEHARILAFYVHRDAVAQTLGFLNAAGVEPQRLCALGVELVNLIHIGLTPPEAPFAIMDIGHEKTIITVCQGKRLVYTRTISIAGRQITEAIARAVDASDDEAERLKIEMGQVSVGELPAPDSIPNKVTRAIGDVLEELLLSIRQTLFAYREHAQEMIEGIYLCGGTVRLAGLDQYLSVHLQQNVTFIDCHSFHFSQVDRMDVASEVATGALALALRGVAGSGLPVIDFRRGEFQYRADTERLEGSIRRAIIATVVIIALGVTYFGIRWYSLSQRLALQQSEVTRLVKQTLPRNELQNVATAGDAVRALQREKKEVSSRIETLTTLTSMSVLNVLRRISSGLPPRDAVEINVDKFHYKPDMIRISAEAASSAVIDRVRQSIETSVSEHKSAEGNRTVPPEDGGEPMVIQFPPAKTGAKGELKFDMIMQSQATIAREASEQKRRSRRR
ncbi:MAG: pilus assembly protein PilM [Deltaproteobacteria bacterium]|nr:pilus assembly protein PilM [Deltaproteobacteria bacterium]